MPKEGVESNGDLLALGYPRRVAYVTQDMYLAVILVLSSVLV
jgi:hypothetical protein